MHTATSPNPNHATFPRLRVNLAALCHNYQVLDRLASHAKTAAVVKADAYGCGAAVCSQALWQAGCRVFFVALAREGASLRQSLPAEAEIYVLGPQFPQDAALLSDHALTPCLYDLNSLDAWIAHSSQPAPMALHVETGINRLAMQEAEFSTLLADPARLEKLDIRLLMSHLACADEPDSVHNTRALSRFRWYQQQLPDVPASLANSAGILLGEDFHFDLVRPGISLYGVNPVAEHTQTYACVASLDLQISQVKTLSDEQCIGYGATASGADISALGIAVGGYADGLFRVLYRPNQPEHTHTLWCDGHALPLHGRVSMDLVTLDLSALPQPQAYAGHTVQVFGEHHPIELAAEKAGTIAYEILTAVDPRVTRDYLHQP